jgi:hypothetical protein
VYELYPVPPYKPVIRFPAQLPEVITPLFTTIPDKLEGTEEVRNRLPPIPTPPATIKDPVLEDVETVAEVIANPEVDNTNVEGLKDIVVFEDKATPDPLTLGLNINE